MSERSGAGVPGRVAVAAGWLAVLVLLVLAVVLTAVRVLPLELGTAVRLASFAPFALGLYAAALVLMLALLACSRRRSAPVLGAVVAVVGLTAHGWWAAPAWWGQTPAAAADAAPVKVMTANVFEGNAEPADLVRIVREEGVDVLVLQEVSKELLPALDADGLGELLPHRIGAPDPVDPVGGTMVFATVPLGAPAPVQTLHQSWLVTVGEGASALTVLAAHPVAPVDAERWHVEHDLLLATAERARPDLVVGDLNATPDHRPVRALDAAGFRDAARLADSGWQPTWPANGLGPPLPWSRGPELPPVVAIDHVLLDDGWTALSTRTRVVARTDHLSLVAEIARR